MSRYGLSRYATAYYGSSDANPYIATSFLAREEGYGRILLTWNSPYGNWSKIKLVRNSYGFPVDPFDGTALDIKGDGNFFAFKEADPTSYDDVSNLGTNQFYYYSLFILETTSFTWIKVGNALALSAKDYGYTDSMYSSIPDIYKITSLGDPFNSINNSDLYNFLSLFGFELSLMHTYTNLLVNRYETSTIGGTLVPTFMQEFGLTYEPEVGLQQSRILLQNIALILKEKGVADGLKEYLKAYSGYSIPTASSAPNQNVIGVYSSKNLMLDYNDSSFEESAGHWKSPNVSAKLYAVTEKSVTKLSLTSNVATLTVGAHNYKVGHKIFTNDFMFPLFNSSPSTFTISAVSATTISFPLTGSNVAETFAYNSDLEKYPTVLPDPYPWAEPTALVSYPNKQKGILAVLNANTSSGTLLLSCGADNAITKGVPVTAGQKYSFSIYSAAGSTTRTITVGINWYDRFGNYLSSSTGTGTANAAGEFNVRISVANKTAPTNAYYAVPTISIASSAGSGSNEWHYFDCAQFEQSTSVTSFEEARQINVILKANRINELVNPHFDGGMSATPDPWKTTGATVTIIDNVSAPLTTIYNATYLTLNSGVATLESFYTNDIKPGTNIVVSGVSGVTNGVYQTTSWGAATSGAGSYVTFNTGGATTAARTAVTGTFYAAGNVVKATATGASITIKSWDSATNSQQMPIYYPNQEYTFSVYTKSSISSGSMTLSITWYDNTNTFIKTDTGSTMPIGNLITSTIWDRPYVTAIAPSNAAYATVNISLATTSGTIWYVDEALFEKASFVKSAFTGDSGDGNPTDFSWEGAANASRSHYYKNFAVVSNRLLNGALDDQLLLGTTIALHYSQPKT